MTVPAPSCLAHLVVRVRDLDRSIDFYTSILGLELKHRASKMAFLTTPGSPLTHELGLLTMGDDAPAADPASVGLYHFAWQMATLGDLEEIHRHMVANGVNIVGYGNHGASYGVYYTDPDGNEIEVAYELPEDQWLGGGDNFSGTFPLPIDIQPVL